MEDSTKIVGNLSEFKVENKPKMGLLDKIELATNEAEVNYLLSIGNTYKKVSNGTIKKWNKVADKKIKSFKVK